MKVKHPQNGVTWAVVDPTSYLAVGWTEVVEDQSAAPESEQDHTVADEVPAESDETPSLDNVDADHQPAEDTDTQENGTHVKPRRQP